MEWFSLGHFSEEKTFHVVFVGARLGMVICFGSVLFGRVLNFMKLSIWIRLDGRVAFFGMVGYLLNLELEDGDPWAVDAGHVCF